MSTAKTSRGVAKALGRNIRTLRGGLGLSLEDLGKAARVDPAAISRIENGIGGDRGVGTGKLERIARALKTTLSELFVGV